ncbi:MAG: pyruvate, phosphate dikinase [Candidatus Thermoplasmatota archaeon]|nr:pyruvate, phosphate dikinase [Candidatus Thermoplasmatota archaeon]MCL5441506.1 pyruvate, phosphate dikinase [Candidatus Thermoplasmatota archaeon]
MADILGGKGAGLAEMTRIGLNVPPGFTISTETCRAFLKNGKMPEGVMDQVESALRTVEKSTGKKFGDPANPLLVSVRSGAPVSMPGMMDTVLNVGLNNETLRGLARKTGNGRFATDAYRRLIQMFGTIVLGISAEQFNDAMNDLKRERRKKQDTELDENDLLDLVSRYNEIYSRMGFEFPENPRDQMEMSIEAVFKSWNSERAKVYRRENDIDEQMGTAVSIVAMVFGNMGNDSATGVAFTRNPNTGEKILFAEYLVNAQGEDVVAGIRTPKHISDMKTELPKAYKSLTDSVDKLEKHYRDMQDIEFTIESGTFYLLQTRSGKRTARAAIRMAREMADEGLIDREEAVMRITPKILDSLMHPQVKRTGDEVLLGKGLAASPGAASGQLVFSSERAIELSKEKKPLILVRPETTADDVRGMVVSKAFLTQKGGMTSHAAVVARAMGKPAVVGAELIQVNSKEKKLACGDTILSEGDEITVDGTSGEFYLGKTQMEDPGISPDTDVILGWADAIRKIGVRANANTPEEAVLARKNGARGIGLARTERMFLGNDRLPIMRAMIMSRDEAERRINLDRLLPMQVSDFVEFFRTMEGFPVIIRLLDPPLHEFLPDKEEVMNEMFRLRTGSKSGKEREKLADLERIFETIKNLEEFNPMLGFRGCRLGISYPEIYEMQVRAIIRAASKVIDERKTIYPEIMIPLVGHVNELKVLRQRLEDVAREEAGKKPVEYKFGTMIEIPRACLTADKIALYADFFSFGTNDLTQMTFGYSRDDAEGKFLARYIEDGILESDPFSTVDVDGVGELMKIAVSRGKKTRPDIEIGICGEHGGDPDTVAFCHRIGLDYVSASPYRIPIARLAGARAQIEEKRKKI